MIGEGKQKWCEKDHRFVSEKTECEKCQHYIISRSFEPNECSWKFPKEGNKIF